MRSKISQKECRKINDGLFIHSFNSKVSCCLSAVGCSLFSSRKHAPSEVAEWSEWWRWRSLPTHQYFHQNHNNSGSSCGVWENAGLKAAVTQSAISTQRWKSVAQQSLNGFQWPWVGCVRTCHCRTEMKCLSICVLIPADIWIRIMFCIKLYFLDTYINTYICCCKTNMFELSYGWLCVSMNRSHCLWWWTINWNILKVHK